MNAEGSRTAVLPRDRTTPAAGASASCRCEVDAIPRDLANPADGGVGPIQFVDPRHGWLLSFPNLLFRTVDGGAHWTRIVLQ